MKNQLARTVLLFLIATGAASASYITITPTIQNGVPGATVGWDFTLHPDDTEYLVIDTVQLVEDNAIGVYTDFLELYLPFAPNTPDQQFTFDPGTFSGVGQYVIDPGTPDGSLDNIQFILSYELDPCDLSQTSCTPDQTGSTLLDQFNNTPSVSIQIQTASAVPEPATTWSAAVPILLIFVAAHRLKVRGGSNPTSTLQTSDSSS